VTPVRLPVEAPGTSVTLQLVDQRRLIVNSLVKPLLMLVLFVVAAELAGLTEEVTVLAAVAGFCSGLWLCRAMSWDILKFSGDDLC
jgi:positive regulator of sigma E activity